MFDDTTQVDPASDLSQPAIASGHDRPVCGTPRATGRSAVLIEENTFQARRDLARAELAEYLRRIESAHNEAALTQLAREATAFTRTGGATLPAEECGRIVFAVLRARGRLAGVPQATRPVARLARRPRCAR